MMEKLKHLIIEAKTKCPIATQDVHVNLENRQHAIDEYYYGPANPDKPGDYWKKAANRWKITEAEAKSMRCGNCAAFDVTKKMLDCIERGITKTEHGEEPNINATATIKQSGLGYCNFFKFKCAADRSCTAWVTGGPIK
jgi:hypothetical protein